MADRHSPYQPASAKGGMDFCAKLQRSPLLPFEKQIIELTGCSEEEYRWLAIEAMRQGLVRPAGYEHIPDVRMDPLTVSIVSLVVGVVSSAASYLLAPKPKAVSAQQQQQITNRDLGSIAGTTRFSPTTGFDSQAELANYGEPIPIIFGRFTGTTGGIVASPRLVWSRMFSYGTQQGVKLLFVIGEQGRDAGQTPQGIDPPSLEGIFIGNGVLNAIYRDTFAFYWKRNTTISGFSRIKAANLLYGTRGTLASGDPETFDDIFSCPTRISENDLGFSSVHSLTNNAEFGCFAPIANGTAFRVNWRVVSVPRIPDQDDDPGDNLYFERVKIAGDQNGIQNPNQVRTSGMNDTGRNYSRRMGITALNGVGVSNTVGTEERSVNKGDVIQFTISSAQVAENTYFNGVTRISVDDINSSLNEERISADNALQLGELFMIGRTVWQVTNRLRATWRAEDKLDQIIELKCVDILGLNRIGLVSPLMLTRNYLSDDVGKTNKLHAGTAFYPLMRFSLGTIRNNRPCDITEIGIRSNVFQQFSGLCNFQTIPTPPELALAESNRVNLVSGTINGYVRRSSAFTIYLRPAGLDPSGQPYAWQALGIRFVVVGNQPIDQYNFIRLRHPEARQYEFQFIPKNGADMRNAPADVDFWQLNASGSVGNAATRSILSADFDTAYGRFNVTTVGTAVRKVVLQQNVEFASRPSTTSTITTSSWPSAVGINTYLPDQEGINSYVTAVALIESYVEPVGSFTQGRTGSFTHELFGRADTSPVPVNGATTLTVRENLPNNQWIELRYIAVKLALPAGHYSGQATVWTISEYIVINSSPNWNTGQEFIVSRTVGASNPFRTVPGEGTITVSGVRLRVNGLTTADQAQGRSQAFLEEVFGPARNFDFGISRQATLVYSASGKFIRFTLSSVVYNIPNHWSGQSKFWSTPVITPIRNSTTSTNWLVGDLFPITYTVSAANPFRTPGSTVGVQFIIQGVSKLELAPGTFTAERLFEEESQYSDITYYGNLVQKSNDSGAEHSIVYVNEMVSNLTVPTYDRMTVAGLSLKASRNFNSLDQIRFWLANGIPVTRFHPDDAAQPVGPSNLLCDLVFHLLTDQTTGLGRVLNMTPTNAPLINTNDLIRTARFLRANRLFFDGAVSNAINVRQFISDTAPYFLCNFVISNGQFSLVPALPTTTAGQISTAAVTIKQLFTAGNILEETFELEYLPVEERKNFQAIIRYRQETRNQLSQERTLTVRWADADDFTPSESFDLTGYCTSRDHAALVAKFFLSIRRRITHTIRFKTTPYGVNLAPGDYIRVVTESSPYSSARNGSISNTGEITSATFLADGQYSILYYKPGFEDVTNGTMTVSGGKAAETVLWGSLFTVRELTISQNVYMVEQLTLDEDGTVQITASEFPCDANLSSLIAQDVTTDGRYAFDA